MEKIKEKIKSALFVLNAMLKWKIETNRLNRPGYQ